MWFNTGDKHGQIEMNRLSNKYHPELKSLTKDDIVCILGDFGLFWSHTRTKEEEHWLNWLKGLPYTVCFVDGNHENHPMLKTFEEVDFLGGRAGKAYENIYHLKRGEIYSYQGHTIFTFGGAASHDKQTRFEHIDWWREEEASYAEIEHALENLKNHNNQVEFVLTHTLPKSMLEEIGFKSYATCATATFLDNILDTVQFKQWYSGHLHIQHISGKFNMMYHNIKRMI